MNKYLKITLIFLGFSILNSQTNYLPEVLSKNKIAIISGGKYSGKYISHNGYYFRIYNSFSDASYHKTENSIDNFDDYSRYWQVEKIGEDIYAYIDTDFKSYFESSIFILIDKNDSLHSSSLPPDIYIENIFFTESSISAIANEGTQSNILKGNSSGYIEFDIINKGRGPALNLITTVKTSKKTQELIFEKAIYSGHILPNETDHIKLPIKAKISAESRDHNFIFDVLEINGFDADTKYFNLSVQEIANPELVVNSVTISDDMEGTSYGNGNGRIEKGETIEVIVQIQNNGTGIAENVNITLSLNKEINGFFLPKIDPINLEILNPNETADITLYFYTNKKITERDVALHLNVTEKSGEFPLSKKINFDIE